MSLLGGGCHSGLLGIAALFEHQTIKSNSKSNYSVLASVMEKHGIGSYMYSTVHNMMQNLNFGYKWALANGKTNNELIVACIIHLKGDNKW